MKNICLLAIYVIIHGVLPSCQSRKLEAEAFSNSKATKNCLDILAKSRPNYIERVYGDGKALVGSGVSYLATGAAYTSEALLRISGGIVLGVVVCSPVIAIEGSLGGNGQVSSECIGKAGSVIFDPPNSYSFGKSTYKQTSDWRCPEVDYISKGLRDISRCYWKDGQEDKAKKQLGFVTGNEFLYNCLSSDEKERVKSSLDKLSEI